MCDICWSSEAKEKTMETCEFCGRGNNIFHGYSCVVDFTQYLYRDLAVRAEKLKTRITVYAHNSKGYDGHFIMQDLFERDFATQPQIILQGLKVLKMGINNVDFNDSLCLFLQPLSALPKSFGFENVVLKGFFPHKFNIEKNWGYTGKIPEIEFFSPEFMSESKAIECTHWHKEYQLKQETAGFDEYGRFRQPYTFHKELVKYCANDVKILTIAMMEFRKLFQNVTRLNPITRNFTLASVAMEHFRSLELQENQIGITPIKGYFQNRNKSVVADIWLDWIQREKSITINREVKIGPFYVDGYNKEARKVYEFFGCYFHGCDAENCNKNTDRNESFNGHKSLDDKLSAAKERVRWSLTDFI